MLSFISFLLVCVGSINWFSIGILQYDFVAGIFGSQSNIFSRIIYTLVGVASIIVIFNLIKNKGTYKVSLKKANKEYNNYMEEKREEERDRLVASMESSKDNHMNHEHCENCHKEHNNDNNNSHKNN